MTASYLTLRLSSDDALLIERLRERTGLSKSDIVKQALWALASDEGSVAPQAQGLYALGQGRFGQHSDGSRRSADLKSVVRARLKAKQGT